MQLQIGEIVCTIDDNMLSNESSSASLENASTVLVASEVTSQSFGEGLHIMD